MLPKLSIAPILRAFEKESGITANAVAPLFRPQWQLEIENPVGVLGHSHFVGSDQELIPENCIGHYRTVRRSDEELRRVCEDGCESAAALPALRRFRLGMTFPKRQRTEAIQNLAETSAVSCFSSQVNQ
jgi:hypothetical protein